MTLTLKDVFVWPILISTYLNTGSILKSGFEYSDGTCEKGVRFELMLNLKLYRFAQSHDEYLTG